MTHEVFAPFMESRIRWSSFAIVVLLLAAQVGPSATGTVTMVALILWSLRNSRSALQSLTLGLLVIFVNPGIATVQPGVSVLKWVLLFVAALRIVFSRQRASGLPKWVPALSGFVAVATVVSALGSADLMLSCFKLASFVVGVLAAVLGFRGEGSEDTYFADWFTTVHAAVVFASLPLAILPVGFLRNGVSFQGVLNQPQALAVYLAPMTLVLLYRCAFARRIPAHIAFLALGSVYCLAASNSRTGVVAMALSVLIVGSFALVSRRELIAVRFTSSTVARLTAISFLAAIVMVGYGSHIRDAAARFVAKGSSAGAEVSLSDVIDQVRVSRGEQSDNSLANIEARPLIGVGFGMGSIEGVENAEVDPVLGIPLSAPTETGFLPLAVLGQVGVFGAVALLGFLFTLLLPVVRNATLDVKLLCWAAICVNFGEMIFFATGGLGLQMWLIVGCCYSFAIAQGRFRCTSSFGKT